MNVSIKKTFIIPTIALLLSTSVAAQTYTVKSGDSMWGIASSTKPDTVSIHQMIAAIHEENSALLGADISSIQPGMELVIPDENTGMLGEVLILAVEEIRYRDLMLVGTDIEQMSPLHQMLVRAKTLAAVVPVL